MLKFIRYREIFETQPELAKKVESDCADSGLTRAGGFKVSRRINDQSARECSFGNDFEGKLS